MARRNIISRTKIFKNNFLAGKSITWPSSVILGVEVEGLGGGFIDRVHVLQDSDESSGFEVVLQKIATCQEKTYAKSRSEYWTSEMWTMRYLFSNAC